MSCGCGCGSRSGCNNGRRRGATGSTGQPGATGSTGGSGATGATGATGGVDPTYLTQPEWEICFLTGNNANSGLPGSPIASYAEYQRRIGQDTTLNPTGGFLHIRVLDDLPDSDPILQGFNSVFADGTTGTIEGTETTITSGTLAAVVDKARAANVPNQITDPALDVATNLGKRVAFGDGTVRAFLAEDFGGGTAHVTTWTQPDVTYDVDGFRIDAPPPAPGDAYRVVQYTRARLGEAVVGTFFNTGIPNADIGPDFREPGGWRVRFFEFSNPDADQITLPQVRFSLQTLVAFTDCIFDVPRIDAGSPGQNYLLSDNALRGALWTEGGIFLILTAGLGRSRDDDAYQFPGGLRINQGSSVVLDYDPTFVGENFAPADIQVFGCGFFGAFSSWNTLHGVVLFPGGEIRQEVGSFVSGEVGYVPYWGDRNYGTVFVYGGSWVIEQDATAIGAPQPPTAIFGTGAGGPAILFGSAAQDDQAHTFDTDAATYRPKVPTAWGNLVVPAPAGFQTDTQVFPDGIQYDAEMCKPAVDANLQFNSFVGAALAARPARRTFPRPRPAVTNQRKLP